MFAPSDATLDVVSQATELIAAHGVYALTAIFIFYQQSRAYQAIKGATGEDRAFFKKVYISVVSATYVLMILSTGIWFYANFMYGQREYIRGQITGLIERRTSPTKEDDLPAIFQSVAPESDVDLYTREFSDGNADGQIDLGWVIFPKQKINHISLLFRQDCEIWSPPPSRTQLFGSNSSLTRRGMRLPLTRKTDTLKLLDIDLIGIHYLTGHAIQLDYVPKNNPEDVGSMFLIEDDGTRMPLPLQDRTPLIDNQNRAKQAGFAWPPPFFRTLTAFAAGRDQKLSFNDDGGYDRDFGNRLRESLGGVDLNAQTSSIAFLVSQGSRSFRFIADSLAAPDSNSYDEDLLDRNLAAAIDGIESKGIHAPPELSLQIALMFYRDQDYGKAVPFFDRAGDGPIRGDDDALFFRGYAHYWLGRHGGPPKEYQESEKDFRQFLRKPHGKQDDALARTQLGIDLNRQDRVPEAIQEYKSAIRLDPTLAQAYNDLAYLYASRGENLPAALDLVNKALRLETDEYELAEDKDTKGWILFQQGKFSEALPLIQAAAAKVPDDSDVQDHLKKVRAVQVAK